MATPANESIVKAFALLNLIARQPSGMTLAEAARSLEMTVPTTHRFLKTLVSVGALKCGDKKRYFLRTDLLPSPFHANRSGEIRAILQRHVETLSFELRETVHVAILFDDMVKYIAKAEAPRSLRITTVVGTTLEAYCTGVGKVLLAFSLAAELARYIAAGDFHALTPKTITTKDGLVDELKKVRARGYAIDEEEFELGLRCIAAPIFSGKKVVAAISSSGPSSRFRPSVYSTIASDIVRTASGIGRELSSFSPEELQMHLIEL